MANRRMFSKDIVRSDAFLELPISSQALYFHLGMEADDRGYVSNPKTVIRTVGSTVGDLEQLANRKFILIRGEGLILIKGWRINNQIQPSRLVETKFTEDLKKLFFDENNSYTEKTTKTPVLEICRQIVDKVSTQDSLDKISIVENSISKDKKDKHEINNDKPLFCESCFQKLVSKKYLALEDLADKDRYLELFAGLLETYTRKNICISLNYIMLQACDNDWDREKECWVPTGTKERLNIDDKYSYLRAALYRSCERFKKGYEGNTTDVRDKALLDSARAFYLADDSQHGEFIDNIE